MGAGNSRNKPMNHSKQIEVIPMGAAIPNHQGRGRGFPDRVLLRDEDFVRPQNRARLKDDYPKVITLVKNPPPQPPNRQYSFGPPYRHMVPYEDKPYPRNGDVILYREPGGREHRKMILHEQFVSHGPKGFENYDSHSLQDIRRMMPYDQPVRQDDRIFFNLSPARGSRFKALHKSSSLDEKNLMHLDISPRRENVLYNTSPFRGSEDRKMLGRHLEDTSTRVLRKVASDNFLVKGSVDSGFRELKASSLSSTASRTSSDSAILTSRELEVEMVDKFQDEDGKIYKIVKPVGERSRIIYTKPQNYGKLLIVESPVKDNVSSSINKTPEQPAEEQEEANDPQEEKKEEEEEEPIKEEPPKVEAKKISLTTTSTQTNPKISFKQVDIRENKTLQLRRDFLKNSAVKS